MDQGKDGYIILHCYNYILSQLRVTHDIVLSLLCGHVMTLELNLMSMLN